MVDNIPESPLIDHEVALATAGTLTSLSEEEANAGKEVVSA